MQPAGVLWWWRRPRPCALEDPGQHPRYHAKFDNNNLWNSRDRCCRIICSLLLLSRVVSFFFSFLICWFQSIIQNENATLCVCFYFFSLFKFSNFSRNHFLTPFFWLACRQLRFLGGTRYNYHCACLVVIFFWYCFASPKFLNWILCHFVLLFFSHTHTQFMGRRFLLGRPNGSRRRTRPTLRFRSRQR
jgi:hypothetical protein